MRAWPETLEVQPSFLKKNSFYGLTHFSFVYKLEELFLFQGLDPVAHSGCAAGIAAGAAAGALVTRELLPCAYWGRFRGSPAPGKASWLHSQLG